ncbi:MAG: hypothetical protein RJA09_884 [Pseudomonadota bacterium]|jgi:uncharacterized membrane protein
MAHIRRIAHAHQHTLQKTGSYYLMHICVAALVAYAVTGDLWAAVALSFIEPSVQAVAYFFHEKAWARRASTAAANRPSPAVGPVAQGAAG